MLLEMLDMVLLMKQQGKPVDRELALLNNALDHLFRKELFTVCFSVTDSSTVIVSLVDRDESRSILAAGVAVDAHTAKESCIRECQAQSNLWLTRKEALEEL